MYSVPDDWFGLPLNFDLVEANPWIHPLDVTQEPAASIKVKEECPVQTFDPLCAGFVDPFGTFPAPHQLPATKFDIKSEPHVNNINLSGGFEFGQDPFASLLGLDFGLNDPFGTHFPSFDYGPPIKPSDFAKLDDDAVWPFNMNAFDPAYAWSFRIKEEDVETPLYPLPPSDTSSTFVGSPSSTVGGTPTTFAESPCTTACSLDSFADITGSGWSTAVNTPGSDFGDWSSMLDLSQVFDGDGSLGLAPSSADAFVYSGVAPLKQQSLLLPSYNAFAHYNPLPMTQPEPFDLSTFAFSLSQVEARPVPPTRARNVPARKKAPAPKKPRAPRKPRVKKPPTIHSVTGEPAPPGKTAQCPECLVWISTLHNLGQHRKTHDWPREARHKCDFPGCTKSFTHPRDVNRHKREKHKGCIIIDRRSTRRAQKVKAAKKAGAGKRKTKSSIQA